MVDVDPGSTEFAEIVKEFTESLQHYKKEATIEKLQRIENRREYQKHVTYEVTVRAKHGIKQVPIRRLYHGSKYDSLGKIVVQGFNRSFAADSNGNNALLLPISDILLSVFSPCSCLLWQRSVFCCGGCLLCSTEVFSA